MVYNAQNYFFENVYVFAMSGVPSLAYVASLDNATEYDGLVVLLSQPALAEDFPGREGVLEASKVDKKVGESVTVHYSEKVLGSRLVVCYTGTNARDFSSE